MDDQPTLPVGLRAELDALLRATPLHAVLGIEVEDWGPGWARVGLRTQPDHANLAGSVHGGVLFALADAAFEIACNGYGRAAVALDTTCHYLAAAPVGGELVAEASEVSRTRRTGAYRLEVRSGDGSPRATYVAMAYRTERWHLGADRWPEDWRARF